MALSPASSHGFQPVGCLVRAQFVPVDTVGAHPLLWSTLLDNPWDANTLTAIPAGLGMTFAFNGTAATITTTVAGTWALTLSSEVVADATFEGRLEDRMSIAVTFVRAKTGDSPLAEMAPVYVLPAAASFAPSVETRTLATGTPTARADLIIVRLA